MQAAFMSNSRADTLLLLDTNAYLRLAKRVRPLLGDRFGQKPYILTILPDVETEVHRNPRLQSFFPWFNYADFSNERLSKQVRLSINEKATLNAAMSILRQDVISNVSSYKNPPSPVDCKMLAFTQIRDSIVVTDDLSMHQLAAKFSLPVMHGHELLKKMHTAKKVTTDQVRDIYSALATNNDLPKRWVDDRDKLFGRIVF